MLHGNLSQAPDAVDIDNFAPMLPGLDTPGGRIILADEAHGMWWEHLDLSNDFMPFDRSSPGLETTHEDMPFF